MWSNCKPEQQGVLLQTLNYKSTGLEKQAGDLAAGRPWVSSAGGAARTEGGPGREGNKTGD